MIEFRAFQVEDAGPYDVLLEPGSVLGLITPGGSGATRLLEALTGARRHRGRLLVDGRPRNAGDVAYAPEEVEQILFGQTAREAIGRGGVAFAERLDATHLLARPPQELSSGERRRLALAAVFGSARPFLLFDRPTAGLDPDGQKRFWQATAAYDGAMVVTLGSQEELRHCTFVLPVPGQGAPWTGGQVAADRQRMVRWPPDEASDLAWTLGLGAGQQALAEEVTRWRAGRKRR